MGRGLAGVMETPGAAAVSLNSLKEAAVAEQVAEPVAQAAQAEPVE
ncbi:hypothetical protein OK074_7215 [Actinobacteria bacterium OK074]|nr:hypothetical protein OK074_7215 [Actinobacteria bacterium OK074]